MTVEYIKGDTEAIELAYAFIKTMHEQAERKKQAPAPAISDSRPHAGTFDLGIIRALHPLLGG